MQVPIEERAASLIDLDEALAKPDRMAKKQKLARESRLFRLGGNKI
jgi:hypothetical protein